MPDGIPDGITRDDVLQAIIDYDAGAAHEFAESIAYDVIHNGKRYPPKAIVGLAARRITGRTLIPDDFKGGVGSRCFRVLKSLGFEIVLKIDGFAPYTTEEPEGTKYVEGAIRSVIVNAYERNPKARQACLDHYGTSCAVCGFDFARVYGEIGEGFIHVHHLRDLATVGGEYEVDPISDLRPVCPNCHAMLHVETPAIGIDDLRAIIVERRN